MGPGLGKPRSGEQLLDSDSVWGLLEGGAVGVPWEPSDTADSRKASGPLVLPPSCCLPQTQDEEYEPDPKLLFHRWRNRLSE